jgi:hypothetical protein
VRIRIKNSLTPAPLMALCPGIEHQSNEADFALGQNLVPSGGHVREAEYCSDDRGLQIDPDA